MIVVIIKDAYIFLVEEASRLQNQRTWQAASYAAQLSVLQGQIESNHKTVKNSTERKRSALRKIRDQKKQRQELEKKVKEGVDQMDIPKCFLNTYVKLSDDAVCTGSEQTSPRSYLKIITFIISILLMFESP